MLGELTVLAGLGAGLFTSSLLLLCAVGLLGIVCRKSAVLRTTCLLGGTLLLLFGLLILLCCDGWLLNCFIGSHSGPLCFVVGVTHLKARSGAADSVSEKQFLTPGCIWTGCLCNVLYIFHLISNRDVVSSGLALREHEVGRLRGSLQPLRRLRRLPGARGCCGWASCRRRRQRRRSPN